MCRNIFKEGIRVYKGVHLIFKDKKSDLWEFHLTEMGDLEYNIVCESYKSSKMVTIGSNVLEFAADIDIFGTINLVYVTKTGELIYCKFQDRQFSSGVIYYFKDNNYALRELTLCMTEKKANIFYILQDGKTNKTGTIYHGQWDKNRYIVDIISHIRIIPNVYSHYQVEILNYRDINLTFINNTNINKEVNFYNYSYKENSYSDIIALFTLKGNSVDFFMIRHEEGIHLLNLSYSNSFYILENVCIDLQNEVISIKRIFHCSEEISHPLLVLDKESLWAFWGVGNEVFYSFLLESWSEAEKLEVEFVSKPKINKYYIISQNNNRNRKFQRIFGTAVPDIKLLLPSFTEDSYQNNWSQSQNQLQSQIQRPNQNQNTSLLLNGGNSKGKGGMLPISLHAKKSDNPVNDIKIKRERPDINQYRYEYNKHISECQVQPKKPRSKMEVNSEGYLLRSKLEQMYGIECKWDKELAHNQIILAQEKNQLELKCAELIDANQCIQMELDALKKEFKAKEKLTEDLEIRVKQMEIEKGNMVVQLKDELEIKKNKGIFKKLLKR